MIIAVDFDGTCVTHDYPEIGQSIGAERVLKQLTGRGHRIILWTLRSGDSLDAAVEWFKWWGIPLFGVNANPDQGEWSDSPKAQADLYIDDAALGAPLKVDPALSDRPFIDWEVIRAILL